MKKIFSYINFHNSFSLFLIVFLGIVQLFFISNGEPSLNKWQEDLSQYQLRVKTLAQSLFTQSEKKFIEKRNRLNKDINGITELGLDAQKELIRIVNSYYDSGYKIVISDSALNTVAWNDNFFDKEFYDEGIKRYGIGKSHFYTTELNTYFSIIDTIKVSNNRYYLFIADVVEKHYHLNNELFQKRSLKNLLSKKVETNFDIIFSSDKIELADTNKFICKINNLENQPIASIIFNSPLKYIFYKNLNKKYYSLEAVIIFILALWLFVFFIKRKKVEQNKKLKTTIKIMGIVFLRIVLFLTNIPARFIEGGISDATYFAVRCGYGLVSSPIEFLVTVITIFFIAITVFEYSIKYDKKNRIKTKKNILLLIAFFSSVAVYLLFNFYNSVIDSVVFNSTLFYFKDTNILPPFPKLLMIISILFVGISFLLTTILLIKMNLKYISFGKVKIILLFLLYQFPLLVYLFITKDFRSSYYFFPFLILVSFLLVFYLNKKEYSKLLLYLVISFAASISSVIMLNNADYQLEKKSFRIKVSDIARPNENLLEFFASETIERLGKNDYAFKILKEGSANYDACAFMLWSNSVLHKEGVNSSILIIDSLDNILGKFKYRFPKKIDYKKLIDWSNKNSKVIFKKLDNTIGYTVYGILPFYYEDKLLGYYIVAVNYNLNEYYSESTLSMLAPQKANISSSVKNNEVGIYEFADSNMVYSFGEISPSKRQLEIIKNTKLNTQQEAWTDFTIQKKDYSIYISKKAGRLFAFSMPHKDFTVLIYDFFKIFFIHTALIIILVSIFFLLYFLKHNRITLNYKGFLLVSFFAIAVIPLLITAFYFRNLTEEKNNNSIYYKLKKRAVSIENYSNENTYKNSSIFKTFNKAYYDLGISFSVFENKDLIFSTNEQYYKIGLIKDKLDAEMYSKIFIDGYTESVFKEEIENYTYNSFYYLIRIDKKEYILKVDDAFNKISLPISNADIDIFLFGSYSLAVIFIIIISIITANKISNPVLQLTKATRKVGDGDLEVEVREKGFGEIEELIVGFNTMVKRLKVDKIELAELERQAAWKEMAKQVAHEIKNPLTPIKLSIQQLKTAYTDKSPKFNSIFEKVTKTIILQIDILKNIASEFSNFAKMPELDLKEVNLILVIREILDLYLDKRIKITFTSNLFEANIYSDKDLLDRMFVNLIRNAIQANAKNILIDVSLKEKFFEIEISDDGKGIPFEIQSKIFNIDFTTKLEGMGLGLYMVKNFLEKSEGSISLTKSTESGTTFLLRIPGA